MRKVGVLGADTPKTKSSRVYYGPEDVFRMRRFGRKIFVRVSRFRVKISIDRAIRKMYIEVQKGYRG